MVVAHGSPEPDARMAAPVVRTRARSRVRSRPCPRLPSAAFPSPAGRARHGEHAGEGGDEAARRRGRHRRVRKRELALRAHREHTLLAHPRLRGLGRQHHRRGARAVAARPRAALGPGRGRPAVGDRQAGDGGDGLHPADHGGHERAQGARAAQARRASTRAGRVAAGARASVAQLAARAERVSPTALRAHPRSPLPYRR
jgi:hypothetical protein